VTYVLAQRRNEDLERELQAHLELEAAEQRESGASAEEARFAARRALGNSTYVKEEVREMWGWTFWEVLVQDARHALRALRKTPGLAATAVLTLALGIGASTAVFTAVDSVVLKPLSYPESGRLVVAWERVHLMSADPVGPNPRHEDMWENSATSFTGFTLVRYNTASLLIGNEHPRLIGTVICSPNLLDTLQVTPMLGRRFSPEEGVHGRDNVAILTYPVWQELFHGDPDVLGKTIQLAQTPRQIVGVLPAGFHFPNANALRAFTGKQPASGVPDPGILIPNVKDLSQYSWNGEYGNWVALARLKPGIPIRQAEAELQSIEARVMREIPARQLPAQFTLSVSLQPMQEVVVNRSRSGLWLLLAAVGGLMLIACVNLANAQLVRAISRNREASVRTALGAAAWRLVWGAVAENAILALAGGAAGVLLAWL